MKPTFIIVGAAKSGTTSLFKYIGQHPEVYVPVFKEPCFFSKGLPDYIRSEKEYFQIFTGKNDGKITGEASTSYLFDTETPKKIKKILKDVKIIILLRNPADRAYSLWGHNYYQTAHENLSFEDALAAERYRIQSKEFNKKWDSFYGHYYYFASGLYFEQVKNYFDVFGSNNVKVYIFEEFIKNPSQICREIFEYIGIDLSFNPKIERHNVAPSFKNISILNFFVRPPQFLTKIFYSLPIIVRTKIYRFARFFYYLNIKSKPREKLNEELRNKLLKKYMEDIKKLEYLLGKDLKIWYSKKSGVYKI